MAQQNITIGVADAGTGDNYFQAFVKIEANFTDIYGIAATNANNITTNTNAISVLAAAAVVNRIVVNQANLATTLGTTIDPDKEYFLDGIVDFAGTGLNVEIPAGGIQISGYNFNISGIENTDAAFTLFTSPVGGSGDVLFKDFFVDIQGAGSEVYDLTGDTGAEAIEIDRINFNNCSSLGTITAYRQGLEVGTGRFGGTPELTLAGAWSGGYFIDTSIVRSLTNGVYTIFRAGIGFVMSSRFRSNQNIDLPASVSFLDFAPANFPNSSTLQLEDCIVSRAGVFDASDSNLTPNVSAGDLVSDWHGNNGLPNTFPGGELNITVEVLTTIAVAGTFVDLLGTYTPADLQHFDEPANGQLRHLGDSPKEFKVSGQIVLDGGSNDVAAIKIVMFRDATTSFEDGKTITRVINNLQGGRNVAYFVINDKITLNENDYVKIQVANITDTTDVTAELDSYFSVEAR